MTLWTLILHNSIEALSSLFHIETRFCFLSAFRFTLHGRTVGPVIDATTAMAASRTTQPIITPSATTLDL